MGLNKQGEAQEIISSFMKHAFYALSLTLLSLLPPLSFLLLARLNTSPIPSLAPSSTPTTILLYIDPLLLHSLVTFLCLATLLRLLAGNLCRLPMHVAWLFICLFQVSISLGVEATIVAGIRPPGTISTGHVIWINRAVFFVGLYETTVLWAGMFVKPVVEDTLFGAELEEGRSADRLVISVAFSALWLGMLREEVEPMVCAAVSKGIMRGVDRVGFVVWLVSHLTALTGAIRIAQGIVWLWKYLFLRFRGAQHICFAPQNDLV